MKKILTSKWRLSGYAFLIFIGSVIGNLIVKPSASYMVGALIGSILLVLVNVSYVFYKNPAEK